ncbi:MAG: penicillin-binding protein [Candidatus Nanopelagicales bacterium]|nr:penicillin-binding protein [Candidatus Nanopelagicales bacterium]
MSSQRKKAPATKKPARQRSAPDTVPLWRRRWLRRLIWIVLVVAALGTTVFAVLLARTEVPSPNELATSEATIVYYADGKNEIGRLGESTRRSVPLAEIPVDVQMAVLAAEDRDFYNHGGISPIGIARAAFNNVTGGNTQGGSTITQQYAKIAFLTQDRTWDRKIREALLAFKLETIVSKEQILEDYLNTIYFGRNANGIEAASIAYFGKPVGEINFEEAAVLAAVIKSPSGLSPEEDLKGLKARWAYVLDSMVDMGSITQEQRDSARFPEITEFRQKDRLGGQVGFLLTAVEKQLLAQGFDQEEIQRGGLEVISSFDRRAQRSAQRAVRENGPTSGTEGLRIGLAAVRPGTGEVVAMYGGKNFIDDQINNATRPFAQAGSTFKPFALAAALEQGVPLNSLWNGNSPATVNGYTFSNYGDNSYGTVSLLQATELSINSAYVELEADIGVGSVAEAAMKAGIPAQTPGMNLDALDLTFVLGTASPSGLDVAHAYATFANEGTRTQTTFIKRVVGSNGGLLYEYEPVLTSEFNSDVANTVNYALQKVVTAGTGKAALALDRPAGAKTGTTDDNKSAWFAGYTPQLAAAVLMAKEDSSGMPISMSGTGGLRTVTGGSFPAAMWTAFMRDALKNQPVVEFTAPPEDALVPLECPDFIEADLEDIPYGCPVPEIVNEFGPEEGTGSGPDPFEEVPADPATTGDPEGGTESGNEFGPEDPTVDEARPE